MDHQSVDPKNFCANVAAILDDRGVSDADFREEVRKGLATVDYSGESRDPMNGNVPRGRKDLDLHTATREQLIAKILNQRTEIRRVQDCYERATRYSTELDGRIRTTHKVLKGLVYPCRDY